MEAQNSYWVAQVVCPLNSLELFSYYLFENGATGVEEQSATETEATLNVFFEDAAHPQNAIETAAMNAGTELRVLEVTQKAVENWQENWKENFKPILIGQQFVIRPPWETAFADKKEIIILPGQGFGTGYHESTRLAIDNVEHLYASCQPKSVIDVGTGSGILSIAAMKLGATQLTAIDIEEEAVAEVPQNMAHSGLSTDNCYIARAEPAALQEPAELVIANIISEVLIAISSDLVRLTLPGGHIILSGILLTELDNVLAAFSESVTLERKKAEGDWVSVLLQKK